MPDITELGFVFLGFVGGVAACGCFAVLFLPRKRKRQPPVGWADEDYQLPVVTTNVLIRERNIKL